MPGEVAPLASGQQSMIRKNVCYFSGLPFANFDNEMASCGKERGRPVGNFAIGLQAVQAAHQGCLGIKVSHLGSERRENRSRYIGRI